MERETIQNLKRLNEAYFKKLDSVLAEEPKIRGKLKLSVKNTLSRHLEQAQAKKGKSYAVWPASWPLWTTDEIRDAWASWCEMRKLKNRPLTQRAANLAMDNLVKQVESTEEPPAELAKSMIDRAELKGWDEFYLPKGIKSTGSTLSVADQAKRLITNG